MVPYATGIERQNLMAPGAEILVLHTYVLGQGDGWANFVQWSAMILSLVGVSLVAKELGAGSRGQTLAVVFVATLPMGIAQATSTMTDYVVALWMIIVAAEVLALSRGERDRWSPWALGAAAGLALLTKPTALAYLLPFALLAAAIFVRRKAWRSLLTWIAVVLVVGAMINAGYFGRNLALYGSPIGPAYKVNTHRNEIMDLRVLTSNLLRNASLHAGTPSPHINRGIYMALVQIHLLMDLDLTDPRTSVHGTFKVGEPSLNELKAGNLLQAVLIIAACSVVLLHPKRHSYGLRTYLLAVSATFVLISLLFKFSIFGSRYHLPFFVLSAPAVGTVLSERLGARWSLLVGAILLLYSWPWLVHQSQRPLLTTDGAPGLLSEERESFYLPESYLVQMREAVRRIQGADCKDIGLAISGDRPEYPFWVLLGAPRSDIRLEWIIGDLAPSAAYRDPDFEPCALICDQTCPDEWETFRGMPIAFERGGYRLYMVDD